MRGVKSLAGTAGFIRGWVEGTENKLQRGTGRKEEVEEEGDTGERI
jgi:hypothetical protein